MAVEALSHEPVRRGSIYCAPSCGASCTFASFSRATKNASRLAEKMGDDWEPKVWENLGWHWAIKSKDGWWHVHPTERRGAVSGYIAFLALDNVDNIGGGTWAENGDTPQEAIKNTLAATEEYTRAIKGATATKVKS